MTEKQPISRKPTSGDDRNLVGVDSTDAALSLEDRLFMTWKNHSTLIIAGVVLVVVLIVGRGAWGSYVEARQARISEAFGLAESIDEKRVFARDNIGHPLAGVALLEVADEVYRNGDYRMSEIEYSAALAALSEPLLMARARMGSAISAIQSGLVSKGEPLLRGIANDEEVPVPVRAEALYHLASVQFAEKRYDDARATLDELAESSSAGAWVGPMTSLRAQIPAEVATSAEVAE
jgi:predicted negative regulator of RcsB-dependent stress response